MTPARGEGRGGPRHLRRGAARERPRDVTRDAGAAPRRAPVVVSPLAGVPAGALAAFALACALIAVTYPLHEPDFWQHLAVGRALWGLRTVPHTMLWTWPTYAASAMTPSWGFRAVVWPFWAAGGVWGLFAWRWLTTLVTFALLLATMRRMGASGVAPALATVAGALAWSGRSQVRPETLVGVLLALELWILETRRRGGPDRTLWLVPLACAWINVHLSYHLGLALLGAYAIDAFGRREGDVAAATLDPPAERGLRAAWRGLPAAVRVAVIAALAFLACFVNPYGARAVWEPFAFFLHGRHEPIYVTIGELQPIRWAENWANGAPVLVFVWPLLALWRWRRRGLDRAEALLALLFIPLAVTSVRFLGFLALVATPFLGRDLAEVFAAIPTPRALATAWPRVVAAGVACVAIALPAWAGLPRGVGFVWRQYPVRACDFMAAHGVRGRGYNTFSYGGYLLWRFWPERDRLPFMDIHQSGTPADRRLYTFSLERAEYWHELDAERRFDWALLARVTFAQDRLPDFLDADSTWALVFEDDAALLFVRRTGPMAAVADSFSYHTLPAGNARLERLGAALPADAALRGALRADLDRVVRESPWHSQALGLRANLNLLERRPDDAIRDLQEAAREDPTSEDLRHQLALLRQR